MSDSRPQDQRLFPGGMTRPKAMLACAALLACSAVLIAVAKRGVLDGIANEASGLAGLVLALSGVLYWIYLRWADRFRTSIGRLMVMVAIMAVLLQGLLIYRQWILEGLPKPPGPPLTTRK